MSNNRTEEGTGGNDDTVIATTESNVGQVSTEESGKELLPGLSDEITLQLITLLLLRKEIISTTTESNVGQVSTEESGKELLPGLPDEITLQLITPLLLWKEIISTLSSVSRAWHCVIRSHKVYDARVRSHSTEKFVIVHRYLWRHFISIGLYSPRENFSCYLPPIPHLRRGFPSSCQCVSLHGKIYILGGMDEFQDVGLDLGTEKVYALDLYGHCQWKRCASMRFRRLEFGCGVLDGKSYVFGGCHFGDIFGESEMYDPEVDAWFPIKSLPSLRVRHRAATVGQELFVCGGEEYQELSEGECEGGPRLVSVDYNGDPLFLELYNPVMDKWRRIESYETGIQRDVFLARGKLHSITDSDIHVYDVEKDSWTLYTFSFSTIGSDYRVTDDWVIAAVAVDDELLLRLWKKNERKREGWSCLLRSRGFGNQSKRIVWETAEGSPSFEGLSWPGVDFMAVAEL